MKPVKQIEYKNTGIKNSEKMTYNFINFNTVYCEIKKEINDFGIKFNFEFEKLKIKEKREILIKFSLEKIIKHLERMECKNPVFFFEKEFNNNLFLYCFKKIEKILCFPFLYCECFDCSKGIKKELSKKSDIFYDKNQYSSKNVKKELDKNGYSDLINEIMNFKSMGIYKNIKEPFEI